MPRKYFPLAILALVLVAAFLYFYGGSQAPPSQPALESLTARNVTDLKNGFNAAQNDVRVLLLLSPT